MTHPDRPRRRERRADLICLQSNEPDRAVSMYINSPGGSMTAMTAIYDTIQYVRHIGRSADRIRADVERDLCLTAEATVDDGLVDRIVPSRKNA